MSDGYISKSRPAQEQLPPAMNFNHMQPASSEKELDDQTDILAISNGVEVDSTDQKDNGHSTDVIINSMTLDQVLENRACFDCKCDHPQWVNVSYAVFLCGACATIHAEFGLLVKPLSDQCLTIGELSLLWKTGNQAAQKFWLATWSNETAEYLPTKAPKDARTKYIIEKYRGKWMHAEERSKLGRVQHAFSAHPAYYGPASKAIGGPSLAHNSYDSIITQTQQLSIHTALYSKEEKQNTTSILKVAKDSVSGKENQAPSFVMHNTGLYSKKKGKKHRQSH